MDSTSKTPAYQVPELLARTDLLSQAGDLGQAEAELRAGLDAHGPDPLLQGRLGQVRLLAGDHRGAFDLLVRSISQRRDLAWIWKALGQALEPMARWSEAARAYEQASRLADHDAEAHRSFGRALVKCGRLEEAQRQLRRAAALDANDAESRDLLGLVYRATGRLTEARAVLEQALELEPQRASAHHHLGLLLVEGDDMATGLAHLVSAARHAPERGPYLRELARAALKARNLALARRSVERAIELMPEDASSHVVLAWIEEATGLAHKAERSHARALQLDPHQVSPYLKLARAGHLDDLEAVERELEHPGRSASQLSELCFAKAEILRRRGEYDEAWMAYAAGNAHTAGEVAYDPAANRELTDKLIAATPAELFTARRGMGDPNQLPVFVVGPPRSGISLVERALMAHSQVLAIGEHPGLQQVAGRLRRYTDQQTEFPEGLRDLEGVGAVRMAADYLRSFTRPARNFECVVDRAPGNFRLLGLAALILPNARVIHVRRDPRDTCVSSWTTHFGKHRCEYSTDLKHLARYHRDYQRLMDHWREVLPTPWLEVEYEAFVADPEAEAQRVLAFLELPWDDADLPHARLGDEQVHGRAVGCWRRFARHLGPLKKLG